MEAVKINWLLKSQSQNLQLNKEALFWKHLEYISARRL